MSFTKYHIAISKNHFLTRDYPQNPQLTTEKVVSDVATLAPLIERVGGPWGWTRRPLYQDLENRVEGTELFLLKANNRTAGYCMTRPLHNLTLAFNSQNVTEIENFGLFPEHNGKGWGKTFLPAMLKILFEQADTVYLSTRSSNHPKVVKFYEDCGMSVIGKEVLPDDLLPAPQQLAPMAKIA